MITLDMRGRKWEIFVSAIELFSGHGYENVSMRDIAKANKVHASSLYNHFPSKESIINQIYLFYCENLKGATPDLEKVLAMVPDNPPHEVLHQTISYYDRELQPLMDKIYRIAIMQAHRDQKAYDVLWTHTLDHSKVYLRTVLQRMIDAGRIEPLDIENFLALFVAFAFTAAFLNYFPSSPGMDGWLKGLNLLFTLVKEIPPAQ